MSKLTNSGLIPHPNGAPNQRFREARERLGLSVADAATRCGLPAACVWDIEGYEDELTACYSAADVF